MRDDRPVGAIHHIVGVWKEETVMLLHMVPFLALAAAATCVVDPYWVGFFGVVWTAGSGGRWLMGKWGDWRYVDV